MQNQLSIRTKKKYILARMEKNYVGLTFHHPETPSLYKLIQSRVSIKEF